MLLEQHYLLDQGWGIFAQFLSYKTQVIWVDRWYPSTKTCCLCHNKQNITLDVRTYKCLHCGNVMNRDLNASINIKQYVIDRIGTIQIYGQGDTTMVESMNCQSFS
jgi:putative transposase